MKRIKRNKPGVRRVEPNGEGALLKTHDGLQSGVEERAAELEKINEELYREVAERRRSEKKLHKSERRLQKLNGVLVNLARSRALELGGLDAALGEIAEAAARTLEVERVNIWLYNEDHSAIHCVEQYELLTGRHSKGFEISAAQYPLYFKSLNEERVIAAHNAHTDPRTGEFSGSYLTRFGISSLLDAQIRVGGRMAGVICHENFGPARRWTSEEQNFAGSMADFVSLSLEAWERRRAETELEKSLSLLRATLESTADGILVVDKDGKITSFNRKFAAMWDIPDSVLELGDDSETIKFVLDRLKEPEVFLAKVKELYKLPDAESYDVLEFKDGRIFERYSQPQRIGEAVVGRVWSFRDVTERRRAEQALREAEEALKESLAQLSKKNRYETIISAVTRSVHRSTDLQDVLDNAVEAINANIDRAHIVEIYLVEGEEAVLKAYKGMLSDHYIERAGRIPYPKGYTWKVIMDEKPRYSVDVDEDTVIGPAGKKLGIKSYLSMPILYERKTIGALNINSFEKNVFDEGELKLLEIVTEQITAALGNARQKGALQEALSEVEELKNRFQTEDFYPQGIKTEHSFEGVIGKSAPLRKMLFKAEQAASTDSAVLIRGEGGTGKALLARIIHNMSARKGSPMVKVNPAELPENQIEFVLFGREERGAFTGAISITVGRFDLANNGTIFFDDIADLPFEIQAKLLRALQEGEFKRLESSRAIKTDVRVIAATSRDLELSVEAGDFREDLYHELSAFPIKVPPLRERKEDIPLFVKHFIVKHGARMGKNIEVIPQKVITALQSYDWPGNVRELESLIECSIPLASGSIFQLADSGW